MGERRAWWVSQIGERAASTRRKYIVMNTLSVMFVLAQVLVGLGSLIFHYGPKFFHDNAGNPWGPLLFLPTVVTALLVVIASIYGGSAGRQVIEYLRVPQSAHRRCPPQLLMNRKSFSSWLGTLPPGDSQSG